jgi:hypothetical protein
MNEKGVSLIEIIISSIILIVGMLAAMNLYIAFHKQLHAISYHYIATGLAREVMEFGNTARFSHPFKLWYKYPPGSVNYGWGLNASTGYALKEWWRFSPAGYPHPFEYIGDIEEKGMVPTGHPESVEIYYECRQDSDFYNAYRQDVAIRWLDVNGNLKERVLSNIPITSNNQLNLEVQNFTWE